MLEELKREIISNIKILLNLKDSIKRYYNKDVEIYEVNEVEINNIKDEEKLKEILDKQVEDIGRLNVIMEVEGQNFTFEYQKKIEELKKDEKDKEFSVFYRTGIITVNGIDVSIDRFYVKEVENEGKTIFNFICTDRRIDKKIFGTIDDKTFEVKNIYPFKKSTVFYEMYLNKELYSKNKIVLDSEEKLSLFMSYVKKWTAEEHKMVAETMI